MFCGKCGAENINTSLNCIKCGNDLIGRSIPNKTNLAEEKNNVLKLKWHEYAWASLPLLLLLIGGAVGGLVGGAASSYNVKLFRSEKTKLRKYTISACVAVMAIFIWYFAAILLVVLFKSSRT